MSEDERIVRHHLRPAPSEAEEALERLLSSTRAEGYARAREQAAELVESNPPTHNRNDHAESIRAMQDGTTAKECEGDPDCGWYDGEPCGPCKAKVSS